MHRSNKLYSLIPDIRYCYIWPQFPELLVNIFELGSLNLHADAGISLSLKTNKTSYRINMVRKWFNLYTL